MANGSASPGQAATVRPVPARLVPFWAEFARFSGGVGEDRFHEAFSFGDGEALADELAELVLRGVKRATASSLWSYEDQAKPIARPGDLSIVTNWAGEPLCVVRTDSVEVVPFREVTAEFARAEGEGDGSLSFWRQAHRRYFSRECARTGREFSEDMLVACERFTVVYRGTGASG